jgi:cellulose synthase operon protein YhjQ
MSQALTIYSSKGGVGKTTLTVNMAGNFIKRGMKVLVIDTDPQNSVSGVLGIEISNGLSELINETKHLEDVILETKDGFDLIQTGIEASKDTLEFTQLLQDDSYFIKEKIIDELLPNYDFILFDTPPGFNPMANSAMQASSIILGILEADPTSYATLDLMESILTKVKQAEEKNILFIINMVDSNDLSVDFQKLLKFVFEDRYLFSLPFDSNIKRAVANCETIYESFPDSPYAVLLNEMLDNFLPKIGN